MRRWVIGYVKRPMDFNLNDPTERAKAYHYTNLCPMWEDEVPELTKEEQAYLDEVSELLTDHLRKNN